MDFVNLNRTRQAVVLSVAAYLTDRYESGIILSW